MRSLLPCFCVLTVASCQSDATNSNGQSNIPVVESDAPEWDSPLEVDLRPLLELGNREGEGPAGFASLSSVRFTTDGSIVASDSQADRLQVFDSAGSHLMTLGWSGEGPGEFADLGRIHAFPGDSVAAFDFGQNRTSIFSIASGEARTVSALFDAGRAVVSGVLSSGSLISYQAVQRNRGVGDQDWDSLRVVLVPTDGRSPQEIARVPLGEARPPPPAVPRILAPFGFIATGGSGFYALRTDRYEITKFDSLGSPQMIIQRNVEPERLTPDLAKEYSEGTLAAAPAQVRAGFQQRLEQSEFAETVRLFGSAFVDHDQRLWVSEAPWPSRFVPARAWSVFASDGRWLGDVEMPEGFRLEDVRENLALGYWTDELGVPFIRVHRLREP